MARIIRVVFGTLLAAVCIFVPFAAYAQNIVLNPSFETPPTANFQYAPTEVPGGPRIFWIFANGGGVQHNGGSFGAANAPDGVQTAFLQSTGYMSQTISLNNASYLISFKAAQRGSDGHAQPVRFSIDGTQVGSLVSPASTSFSTYSIPFTVATAGIHTVKFEGTVNDGSTTFIDSVVINANPPGGVVSNSVVQLGISATRGSAIDSFKVLGTETIDVNDLGRELQASLFFPWSQGAGSHYTCGNVDVLVGNLSNNQEAGDACTLTSNIYALGTSQSTGQINVGAYPRDWVGRGVVPPGLRIEGHHQIGPLSYMNDPDVVLLQWYIFADQQSITPTHVSQDANLNNTPIPFLPAIYFRGDVLTRLFGLSIDGATWTELTGVASGGPYTPSLYRYRAMAWMRPDLGWGVGLYARSSLNQTCATTYTMALPSQQGQCPNFAAEKFPNGTPGVNGGTNNLSIVDQALPTIPGSGYVIAKAHLAVGSLSTIQNVVNGVYSAGQ